MQRRFSSLVLFGVLWGLMACAHQAKDISGPWKHADKSAWFQITFQDGTGVATVAQHDGNASAEGLAILQDIQEVPGSVGRWQGKIYSAEVDDFVDVDLKLNEDGSLVISSIDAAGQEVDVLRLIRD